MSPLSGILLAACVLLPLANLSADTVTLVDGSSKEGHIWGVAQDALVLSIQPVPGLAAVELRIPKARVGGIAFSPDEQRDMFLQNASQPQLLEVADLWERFAPLLSLRGSPAARIGLRYGLLLLATAGDAEQLDPLAVFKKIAETAPSQPDQEAALQGVLRTLLKQHQWESAESKAMSLTKAKCGIALLAEARLTLGLIRKTKLHKFVEEHPRWNADEFARPQREALYESALDNLLGAAFLPGAPSEIAGRARWCAMEIHAAAGEPQRAAILAQDIVLFHPETREAALAADWLRANPVQPNSKPK